MTAAREGFCLGNKYGRRSCWRYFKRFRIPPYFWLDNIGPLKCWILRKHKRYVCDTENGKDVYACQRCGRFVDG